MKTIALTRGYCTKVDDADYEWLNQWKWCAIPSGRTVYVSRGQYDKTTKKITAISMHRLIMDYPKELQVDHINGDGLDNRRCNLRIVDRVKQSQNRPTRIDNKSGYKGVYLWRSKGKEKWRAQIKVNGKRLHLGLYDNVKDAAAAYLVASDKYYKEFARS